MSFLNSIIKTFVGDKTKKDLALIHPIVSKINEHFNSFESISNDELREKTAIFKNTIQNNLKENTNGINEIKSQIENTPDLDQKELYIKK